MERQKPEITYVRARVGGVEYNVTIPMTAQTMSALRQAQAGRPARMTDQVQPATKQGR